MAVKRRPLSADFFDRERDGNIWRPMNTWARFNAEAIVIAIALVLAAIFFLAGKLL